MGERFKKHDRRFQIRWILIVFLLIPFLQNCSSSSSGDGAGIVNSESMPGSNGAPPSTTEPAPVCSGVNMTDLYNTTVTNYTVSQDEIAKICIDGFANYEQNINFSSTDVFMSVRFQTTCASRWCDQKLKETASVGVVKTGLIWNSSGSALDVQSLVQVQCRSSAAELTVDACYEGPPPQKPLETYTMDFNDPRCHYCGCTPSEVGAKWGQGKQALIDCGTAFCDGENSGFHWGILSEVNSAQFVVRCSRATVQ